MKKTLRGKIHQDEFQTTFIPDAGCVGIDVKALARVMDVEFDSNVTYELTLERKEPKSGATVVINDDSFLHGQPK